MLSKKSAVGGVVGMLVGMGLLLCSPVWADEVTEAINEALEAYKKGKQAEAVQSLEYAAQLIRQQRGGGLVAFLPAPLPGWTAQEPTAETMGAMMMGSGIAAKRDYQKDSSSVTITIITDSPLMQNMMMLFTNPAIITSQGGKLQKIQGQKAIVKYSGAERQGEIQLVVENRFLITVQGHDVTQEELVKYAAAINFEKLAAF